jgi:hypothetical protein
MIPMKPSTYVEAWSVVLASSDLCNLPAVDQRKPLLPENQVEDHLWVLVTIQVGHQPVQLDHASHAVGLLGAKSININLVECVKVILTEVMSL